MPDDADSQRTDPAEHSTEAIKDNRGEELTPATDDSSTIRPATAAAATESLMTIPESSTTQRSEETETIVPNGDDVSGIETTTIRQEELVVMDQIKITSDLPRIKPNAVLSKSSSGMSFGISPIT